MKSLLWVMCFTMCVQVAQAQYKKRTSLERAKFFTKEITDYVSNITDSQTVALVEINRVTTESFDSLKALQLEYDAYKPAARAIFQKRDASIKTVLNATQYDEYLMLQAEKRDKSKQKNKQNRKVPKDKDAE